MDVREWLLDKIAELDKHVIPNMRATLHGNMGALEGYKKLLAELDKDHTNDNNTTKPGASIRPVREGESTSPKDTSV